MKPIGLYKMNRDVSYIVDTYFTLQNFQNKYLYAITKLLTLWMVGWLGLMAYQPW